ncbi:hypothetical protein BN1723_003018, partial [Verticillium longisporum]
MTPATTPLRDRNYSAVFQRHITGEWKRKKAPNGLKKAWTGAQSLPKDTTERIFCDAGFQAWVSYRLATNVGGTHYSGKMDDMETIAALHQLPISSRQNIASELANTAPHPTFDAAVKKIQPGMNLIGQRPLPRVVDDKGVDTGAKGYQYDWTQQQQLLWNEVARIR